MDNSTKMTEKEQENSIAEWEETPSADEENEIEDSKVAGTVETAQPYVITTEDLDKIGEVVGKALDGALAEKEEELTAQRILEELSNQLNLGFQWTVRQIKDFMGEPLEVASFNRIKGFLNSLIQLYFTLQDLEWKAEEVSPEQHRRNYANLRRLLEMALYTQNLTKITPKEGEPVDLTHHQAIDVIACDDPELNNTVAEVIRDGFAFAGKPFQPAVIVSYQYHDTESSKNENNKDRRSKHE